MDSVDGHWGLSRGYSADGIRWAMNVGRPHRFNRPVAPNGILFGWDPNHGVFVHYHRKSRSEPADVDGRLVRVKHAVMRTASPDFETWGDTREVLRRGKGDPPRWSPSHGVDLAGALYTEDLYIGSVDTGSTHFVEDVPEELWNSVYSEEFAEYRTELVMSRDGIKWDRPAPHWEFFTPGLYDSWDRDHVALAKPIACCVNSNCYRRVFVASDGSVTEACSDESP